MTRNWAKVSASVGYGTIKFTYLTNTLFNNVVNRTTKIAKPKKDANNKSMFADYAITQDDRYYTFRELSRDAIRDIFQKVIKLVNAVSNSLFITEDDSVDADQLGFSLVDHESYDDNRLDAIDHNIFHMLLFYIMKEWYKQCALGDEAAVYTAEYIENDVELNNNLAELLKRVI